MRLPVKSTIEGQQNFSFDRPAGTLMWIDRERQRVNPDGTLGDFAFFSFEMMKVPKILDDFASVFAKVTFETAHKLPFETVRVDDRDYMILFGDEDEEEKRSDNDTSLALDSCFRFGKPQADVEVREESKATD